MEYYETAKISGYRYRIESDDFVSLRVSIDDVQACQSQWIGFRITQGLKIVIDRWTGTGMGDQDDDREYILSNDEENEKVHKAINDGRALLTKLKQVQQDEEQASLIGSDLADLEYDLMIFVGQVFVDFGKGSVPEAIEEALKL